MLICWLLKTFTAFLCYGYISYVVLVQFGRPPQRGPQAEALVDDESAWDQSEADSEEQEHIRQQKLNYRNLRGMDTVNKSSEDWKALEKEMQRQYEERLRQEVDKTDHSEIMVEYTYELERVGSRTLSTKGSKRDLNPSSSFKRLSEQNKREETQETHSSIQDD